MTTNNVDIVPIDDVIASLHTVTSNIEISDELGNEYKTKLTNMGADQNVVGTLENIFEESTQELRGCVTPFHNVLREGHTLEPNEVLEGIYEINKIDNSEQGSWNNSPSHLLLSPSLYDIPDINISQTDLIPDCEYTNTTELYQWSEQMLPSPPQSNSNDKVNTIVTINSLQNTSQPMLQEFTSDIPIIGMNFNLESSEALPPSLCAPLQILNNHNINVARRMEIPSLIPSCEIANNNIIPLYQEQPSQSKLLVLPGQSIPHIQNPPRLHQAPHFSWSNVFPEKCYADPTEIVVMRPLRTRKLMSNRTNTDFSTCSFPNTASSSISREHRSSKNLDRRKQKLCIIPDADKFSFEIPIPKDCKENDIKIAEHNESIQYNIINNNNNEKLYSETEMPELDEIFKRKRRGINTRRNTHVPNRSGEPPSPHLTEKRKEIITAPSPESTYNEEQETNSDLDSDEEPLVAVTSMKCQNCRKIFKTSRSLTIHSKRCNLFSLTSNKSDNTALRRSSQMFPTTESNNCSQDVNKINETSNTMNNIIQHPDARPLTRSQTNVAKDKSCETGDYIKLKKRRTH